jgi:hypothetical protein
MRHVFSLSFLDRILLCSQTGLELVILLPQCVSFPSAGITDVHTTPDLGRHILYKVLALVLILVLTIKNCVVLEQSLALSGPWIVHSLINEWDSYDPDVYFHLVTSEQFSNP